MQIEPPLPPPLSFSSFLPLFWSPSNRFVGWARPKLSERPGPDCSAQCVIIVVMRWWEATDCARMCVFMCVCVYRRTPNYFIFCQLYVCPLEANRLFFFSIQVDTEWGDLPVCVTIKASELQYSLCTLPIGSSSSWFSALFIQSESRSGIRWSQVKYPHRQHPPPLPGGAVGRLTRCTVCQCFYSWSCGCADLVSAVCLPDSSRVMNRLKPGEECPEADTQPRGVKESLHWDVCVDIKVPVPEGCCSSLISCFLSYFFSHSSV